MSTAQQTAARHNGAKSLGPVTTEGKARSSKNATTHALTGGPVVLPTESQELFDELKTSYLNHYRPTTAMESDLIDEITTLRWRIRRLSVLETAILDQACEAQLEKMGDNPDPQKASAKAFVDVAENSKAWRMLERYQRTLRRSYERARAELEDLGQELAYQQVAAEQQSAREQTAREHLEIAKRIEAARQIEAAKQNEPQIATAASAPTANPIAIPDDEKFLEAVLPLMLKQNPTSKQPASQTANPKTRQNETANKRAIAA